MDGTRRNCLRETIGEIFVTYYKDNVFSAASLALSTAADGSFENWFAGIGRYGENDRLRIDEKSLFDLASLTKPLVTLPAVLHLIDRKKIVWNETLPSLLERDVPEPLKGIELHNLLAHNAGFAAHRNYWQTLKSIDNERKKEWLIGEILSESPAYQKGSRHIYSDLGYILLGCIVEIKSGQRLDAYWRTAIAQSLQMEDQLFFPVHARQNEDRSYVSTGVCRWSGKNLDGIVHDDNCRALGGIAGHAGLFGSSTGVLALCREYMLLYHGRKSRLPITAATFKKACVRVNGSEWTRGFNLPSVSGSSSGRFFSPYSLGHLGFTGVSFWIDVDRKQIVCLLTNRVIEGENSEGIKKMRPQVHDAVVNCLKKAPRNSG